MTIRITIPLTHHRKGMAMNIDRTFQLDLLTRCADAYPRGIQFYMEDQIDPKLVVNALYLEGHGLVKCDKFIPMTGDIAIVEVTITERGIDFISDDGGLSAILGVVTVKLHEDTLKQLVERKIAESDLPPEQKSVWLEALRQAPGTAMKHLTEKLVDEALTQGANALRLVGSSLGFPV